MSKPNEAIGAAFALLSFAAYCLLQRKCIGLQTFAAFNVATSLALGWYNLKKSAWASLGLNVAYLIASLFGVFA